MCASATTWLYMHHVLSSWLKAKDKQGLMLKAQMGDLYAPWVGSRELLLHRRNPYGKEVSDEIQTVFYGRPIRQTYDHPGIINEQRFAYPVYVAFLLAPTVFADFAHVQRWAPVVEALLIAISVFLCLDILRWLSWKGVAALILFTLSSPQIVQGLRLEQLAVVVGCLLIASTWAVHKGHLVTAGVLLAFATIKPQMALLPLVWFVVWAVAAWRLRWRLLLSVSATAIALIGTGELLLPGWLGYFVAGLAAYRKYFPTTSVLRLLLGDVFGIAVSVVIVIWLLAFGWAHRKVDGDSMQFVRVLAVFLMATVVTFPLFAPFNQVLLILPAFYALHEWQSLWSIAKGLFVATVFWPWITAIILLLARPPLNPASDLPLIPAVAEPLVPLLLPLLILTRRELPDVSVHGKTV